ncbi:MAG: amidohydrolase family protein [Bacteroidia bacterium]|nr:amidohydrolase family protein [Bacteroidia bacterium]
MVIDSHLHLNEEIDGTAVGAADELNRQLVESEIERAIVLHLETQPWSIYEFSEAIAKYPRMRGFININPNQANFKEKLLEGIELLGFIGLKLHPRLQGFNLENKNTIQLVQYAGEIGVPVIIDAFPDGTFLMDGFSPLSYANLAQKCPKTKMVWAHMGGHRVIEFMLLAKRLQNVFFDFSYSLLYFQESSIPQDMVFSMRSMKFDRIFYGSDYPDRTVEKSLKMTLKILRRQKLNESEIDKIMYGNAQKFFLWDKL